MRPLWSSLPSLKGLAHCPFSIAATSTHTDPWFKNCLKRRAKLGRAPKPLPKWLGNILASVLLKLGPTGLEFGRYSIDYHFIRNFLYAQRHMGAKRAEQHIPGFAKRLVGWKPLCGEPLFILIAVNTSANIDDVGLQQVAMYDAEGAVSGR